MFRKNPLAIAVHAATAGIASLAAVPALSQEGALVEEIVVTGSRIQQANLVTTSPVTQLDAEQLSFSGVTRVEDVLGSMPQVYLDQSAGQSIESIGTATMQLRNLGVSRTLVLVNGKRLPINSPSSVESGPDLNFIPMQLVERVEILTGGASSTYGSDAVAGVVNFIMNDHFEGVQFDAQIAGYRHDNDGNAAADSTLAAGFDVPTGTSNDGDITDATLIIGGNLDGGRGNITAYATYREVDPVVQADRDYSACANGWDGDTGTLGCGGSATNGSGSFYFSNDNFTAPYHVEGDQFVPGFGTLHNFAAPSYYQRPDERYTLGAFAHYDVNDKVELYSELMFMDNRTVAQFAESGIFFSTNSPVNCDNPLLSDQQRDIIADRGLTDNEGNPLGGCGTDDTVSTIFGRRNVEGGPRFGDIRHSTYRLLGGVRGEFNDTWRYDASYQYAEVDLRVRNGNYVDVARVEQALLVNPDGTCTENSDECVPWNLWESGGVTPEQTEWFAQVYNENGQTTQEIFSAYVQGSLGDYGWRSPLANDGVEVVLGYEYRDESLVDRFSDNARRGEVGGLGAALVDTEGSYSVNEWYVEASIPVIEGRPGAEEVIVDLGYRYSDYSPSGQTTDTYKIAGSWAFNPDVKLRGSYQRAVRAPNIVDQFAPQQGSLFAMSNDPCRRAADPDTGVLNELSVAGYNFEQCARSGVSQGVWDAGGPANSPAQQYNTLIGGDPELRPEESDTYSVGVIFTPGFAEGLAVSVDYYDIDVQDAIDTVEGENTLVQCIENGLLCENVHRGTNDTLWLGLASATNGVFALSQNIGFFRVKGIDAEVSYTFEAGNLGTVSINNVTGYIDSWEQEEFEGAGTNRCEGGYGGACDTPTMDFRNRFQTLWDTPWDVTLSLTWRHFAGVDELDVPADEIANDLESVDYIDLAGNWQATEWLNVRAGVNNLFDKEPPFVSQGITARENGNTYPGVYDALGQYWYLGTTIQF